MVGVSHEASDFTKPRYVRKKIQASPQQQSEGAIFKVSIGGAELKNFDPFVLLLDFAVSPSAGFPDHPHRGFEAVTYMLEGAFSHQDNAGHKGTIGTGDVQWMTAGEGIIHSEMPAGEGVNRGLQLWVNLSSKDKMMQPRYQELQSKDISCVAKDGFEVRIVAGEAFGVSSPIHTRTPAMYLDFTLEPGAEVQQSIPEAWNCFVYVLEGEGIFGNQTATPAARDHLLVLSGGDGISIWNRKAQPLRFLLVGGQPLNEPIVRHGTFVMNSQAEIEQAIEDFNHCRNGFGKGQRIS